ncbi:PspA/IM30 family protein [Opitutales bacterium ASA1]|uniref:PspA/IM30 family protein n=1 Tax=Congregicoccus parvus TaxID=3081749 RepID=UPI002B28FEFE|nr:PspA/IM30 family protein [Opitutales bacterium ASA1]
MENRLRDRIARVLTSTAHTLVDKIEGLNEEGILEAAIREVDGAIDEVHTAQGEALARKHHVNKAIERLNLERTRLEEEAEVALRSGREDLAVTGLRRIDDIERQIPELESQMLENKADVDRLGQSVESLRARRGQMSDDLQALRRNRIALDAAASSTARVPGHDAQRKAERAESAFNERYAKSTGVDRGVLQARVAEQSNLRDLAELSRDTRVHARLAELKARLGPATPPTSV